MNREKKWTPGPWEVDHACSIGFRDTLAIYHCPNQSYIIEIIEAPDEHNGQCIHGDNENQREANAALISAAPELVQALEMVMVGVDYQQTDVHPDVRSYIDAALAKAYGETP